MLTKLKTIWTLFREQLILQVIVAILCGVLVGIFFPDLAKQLNVISVIFIKLIKLVIVPLIFVSIIIGICGHHHQKSLSNLAVKSLIYFEIMSIVAIGLAFLVIAYLKPGAGINIDIANSVDVSKYFAETTHSEGIIAFIVSIVPDSFFGVLSGHNLLPVVVLAAIFAIAIMHVSEKDREVALALLKAPNAILFALIGMIAAISPLAAFGAIANAVGQHGFYALISLGYLIVTIIITMSLFILILAVVAKWYGFSLWALLKHLRSELLVAFSTSSSEAVFPQLLARLQLFGCSKSVTSFVLPAGYSFNLDGTAIYVVAGALFIQQAYGITFEMTDYLMLFGIILVTSKGAAGVTGAGFITLAATLAAIPGHIIPLEGLALLLGIDRFMSDLRTMCNVIGNSVATVIIAKAQGEFTPVMTESKIETFKDTQDDAV